MGFADVATECRSHLEDLLAKLAFVWILRTVWIDHILIIVYLLGWLKINDVFRLRDPLGLTLLR